MLPDELETVAARHVPGEGKLDIRRLSDGLVNETYRVVRGGDAYALRVTAANPYDLGLDPAWEARVLERAVLGALAPVVEYCDPARGILISRWIDGRTWSPAEVRTKSNIARMAVLARRIHAMPLPQPARLMNPRRWIDCYSTPIPGSSSVLRATATARMAALEDLPSVAPMLCHSDLHTPNLVDRGDSLVLLDWEYAHGGDPLWDLAGWGCNNDLDADLRRDLLARYAGRVPTHQECLRLDLMSWLYDYVCLLWSELYLNLQPRGGRVDARPAGAPDVAWLDGVAARARLLAARLSASK